MRRPVRVALALSAAAATVAAVAAVPILRSDDPAPSEPLADLRATTHGALDVQRSPDGTVRSLGTEPGQPIRLSTTDPAAAADELVNTYGHLLGPGELVPQSTTPRLDGGLAVRFQQEVDGIPVLGGEASVQVDADGGVLSSLADLSSSIDGAPRAVRLDRADARAEATRAVAADLGVDPSTLSTSAPARWWYDPATIGAPSAVGARLTWRTEVTDGDLVHRLVLVDTATGTVRLDLDLVGAAADRAVCDFQGFQVDDETCLANDADRAEGDPPTGVPDVDRAYDALGAFHDFFASRFGWEGYDGAGGDERAAVRICRPLPGAPCPYQNAGWAKTQAFFGPGFAVDDVVAHEMTHGVTQQTARLFFSYQSGAINESMSDVFGELIDQATGSDDTVANRWLIGEDLPGGPIRDMADPASHGDPDSMTSTSYAAGPNDSGGVHHNSGVNNRAAVLLADGGTLDGHTVRALGPRDTAQLYFSVLTDYLTSGSDYADLAVALPQACRDLVGTGGLTSSDCTQVDEAVAAVHMAAVPPNAPATDAAVCAAGQTPVDAFADDFETPGAGNWATETLGGWYWSYPPLVGQRYATSGDLNLWGPDLDTDGSPGGKTFGDARIALTRDGVVIPADAPAFVRFQHAYAFERTPTGGNRDGGIVEYSTDDGATWQDLGPRFVDNGYSGTLSTMGSTNPLAGRSAFVDESRGFVASRANLTDLAGQEVRLRFRIGSDAHGGDLGWYVDDLRIYSCPPTGPQLEVTQAVDADRVVAGDPIGLTVTVTNTGTVPLTGLTVDTPEVPGCTGPVADLDPGEHDEVECEQATVDPDDIGTFTSTASADAAEVVGPIDADPVDVTVLAPSAAELEVSQSTEQDTVLVGDDIDLTVTLRNTGAVTLTGLDVSTPEVADCDGPAGDLDPGGTRTVECTYTTVDPDDIGTFTSTASATSNEIVDPVAAAPAEVTVLAPDRQDPTVTVVTPVQGAIYNEGQVVLADYHCADDSGHVDCAGTVPNGQPLVTTTVGVIPFNVVATDLDGNEVVGGQRTYIVASRRPDGRIRQGATGPMVGDDVVNTSGARQNRTARIPRGGQVTFFVTAQNDGSQPEPLRVKGQPGTTNYGVRYFSAGHDITTAVRNGTYQTPSLAVGAVRTIKVVVTVGTRAPVGSQVDRLVTVSSSNDPTHRDVVRFIVKRR